MIVKIKHLAVYNGVRKREGKERVNADKEEEDESEVGEGDHGEETMKTTMTKHMRWQALKNG